MPTRIGQVGYRRFDDQGSKVSRAKGASAGEGTTVWVRGPWPGWEPDLDPSQASPGGARTVVNLVDRDGVLSHQNGFERVDSTHLPLGDTTPPSSGGEAEPVVGLFEGRTNATQALRKYALTADDSTDASSLYGHLYELVAGVWTHRAGHTAAESYQGDATDPGATLADAAHFAAGDYTVFVGGTGANLVNRFPGIAAVGEYEKLPNLGSLTSLGAQSVFANEERILVLNTNEGGTVFPARLRWTSKGANAKFDPTATGAGFADFNDFGAEGLAVRAIGPKLALYFVNGVAFIRRTGNVIDPFAKDYTAYGRGLLGTHSIVDVGNSTHFGIFTDGWFYLDYSGNWTEVGVTQSRYHKWLREFYGRLSWRNRKRVSIEYDVESKLIYVAWPDATTVNGEPTVVWLYDMKSDTVWPAPDYPQQPNLIKALTEEVAVGRTWDSMTASWDSTPESWDSFGGRVGQKRITHGTEGGLVFTHTPTLITRDGTKPVYNYELNYFGGSRTDLLKRVARVPVSYTRQAAATPMTVTVTGNTGRQVTGTLRHTKGSAGQKQVDFVSAQLTAHQHTVGISGTAPVAVDGLGVHVFEIDSQVRKEQAP